MRKILLVTAVVALVAAIDAAAQPRAIPEVRPFVGAFIPTGDQRDIMDDALLVGAQIGFEMAGMVHLVGTFGYTNPDALNSPVANDLRVYQYDVGVEVFRVRPMVDPWTLRPFVGAGLGARTHDFRNVKGLDGETYFAGYGAVGTEFQTARVALRLEVRDYLTRFKGLLGNDKAKTRNDLMLAAGVAVHLW